MLDILYTRLDGWLQPWDQSYDSILFTIIVIELLNHGFALYNFSISSRISFDSEHTSSVKVLDTINQSKSGKKADFAADNSCKTHANILFGSRARILLLANMAAKSARQKNIQHRKHITPDF